ncbi:hypothetical protein [Brevundimonas vancanneytii]|uniref:Uncharacterized protein n=1 Tax=Brevundimonas vancanneytii TaxID=1325724 RepID=A0A4P1JRE8_9CAUL|nr:hypothetical protein [Brevundimonas vancanneytii]VTO10707.1 Uncharacterised protein [Brevundimonas vancanneytii]
MSMTPGELIELANQLLIVAGRIPGVITVTGPPANTLGAIGSSAFWAEERTWYGPKTAEGWPPGVGVTPTVPTFATEGEVRAGKTTGKIIDPQTAADALWPVTIVRTAAAAGVNFDSFINCNISLDANGTLGPPSGGYPGKSGTINVFNATGSATMAFASAYRMPNGGITIEAGVNASTRIPFMIADTGAVILFPASKWSA